MGEKINSACLSVDSERVFVSFVDGVLRTATRCFYRQYKDSMWACTLEGTLSEMPKKGQRLRITNWHHGLPVKIEIKEGKTWETIYERDELPEGIHCLANCAGKVK